MHRDALVALPRGCWLVTISSGPDPPIQIVVMTIILGRVYSHPGIWPQKSKPPNPGESPIFLDPAIIPSVALLVSETIRNGDKSATSYLDT